MTFIVQICPLLLGKMQNNIFCKFLWPVDVSFLSAKLVDCSVTAVMKLSLGSSWGTPWALNFSGCRCWDPCLWHSLWVLLCWISLGDVGVPRSWHSPTGVSRGVTAVRCCHWPTKARIPGIFPFAAWNSELAWCWGCYSRFGGRGAPKRPLSGKAAASSPGSLVWAVPQTSLLPQPSSLCGNLQLRQQTLSAQVIHFSWQLLTEMFLCLALF